jgi:hypothetical protein
MISDGGKYYQMALSVGANCIFKQERDEIMKGPHELIGYSYEALDLEDLECLITHPANSLNSTPPGCSDLQQRGIVPEVPAFGGECSTSAYSNRSSSEELILG